MSAPIGNKFALGHGFGRSPHDREKMAEDLIKWVEEDEKNWRIKTWRIKHKIPRQRVMEMCNDSEVFRDAYGYALDVIAERREIMNHANEMKDSLYNQHLRIYDKDYDAQRKETIQFESECKNQKPEIDSVITIKIIDATSNSTQSI